MRFFRGRLRERLVHEGSVGEILTFESHPAESLSCVCVAIERRGHLRERTPFNVWSEFAAYAQHHIGICRIAY